MENKDYLISYFPAPITNKIPARTVTLAEVARMVGSSWLKPQTEWLRSLTDKARARAYKGSALPYVTPSGVFTYCNDASIVSHSGALCIDLDGVADADGLKRQLTHDRHLPTLLAFRSPSGNGVKWFVGIDLGRCDHRTWFQAVRNYLLGTYDCLDATQVDAHVGNLSRACFLCYDPEVYVSRGETGPLLPFDPAAWAGRPAAASQPKRQPATASQSLRPTEELAKAKAVAYALMRRGASIAESYGDYVKLGFALANGLGSEGRRLFHMLCSQSQKYREADCERKWQECMSRNDGRTTIATFYHMARLAGVDLRDC